MANVQDEKKTAEEAFLGRLLGSIDAYESTEWENETKNVSTNIREALSAQLEGMRGDACNKKFLDYCNCIKSLLAVYNFGKLPSEKDLRAANASKQEIDDCRQNTEKDKKLIKDGVQKIIEHVQSAGFDITPYLDDKECLQIFGDGEKKITVPVTMSATTVMTTLVYFRRACKRQGLYSDVELGVSDDLIDSITSDQTFLIKKDGASAEPSDEDADKLIAEKKAELADKVKDLHDCVAFVIAKILYLFAAVVDTRGVENKYIGWGFSLNSKRTQSVTLSDTYAVVDAISRFDDAFNQDDETKRDQIFLDKVLSFGACIGFRGSLIEFSLNSIYRTAYNIYKRDKSRLYGKSLFYITSTKNNSEITYTYSPITYEQIASSNRSSALFNPLYLAMITMYGYNEKELVIRRLMDDDVLAKQLYDRYETCASDGKKGELPEGVTKRISEYAKELKWFKKDFDEEAKNIIEPHESIPITDDHELGLKWRRNYDIARVFQKYLETQVPDELMKIEEYRDYLNATKDAIDQVQVAYRKFDDSQRLGIVDTDYMMFSALDVGPDPVIVSKLNKTNISANYLRPLLLSSKIMIVSALTRYPQSDMSALYNAIKESKHRKVIASGAKNRAQSEKRSEWLWNEDTVDMNSTARHCEAIMYDYFDYYEKYELSYKSLSNIKKYYKGLLASEKNDGKKSVYLENGELDFAALMSDGPLGEFKRVVLDLTRQNVDKVKVVYTENLQEKDREYQKLLREKEASEKDYELRIADLKKANEKELSKERKRHEAELQKLKISIDIGNTVRGWIKDEADRNLRDMLSYMILNNINGRQDADDFSVGNMMRGKNNDEIADGKLKGVSDLSKGIMTEYRDDTDAAEKLYGDKFRDALGMQSLLEYALDDLLKNNNVRDAVRSGAPLEEKNAAISVWYNKWKSKRQTGVYNIEEDREQTDADDSGSNDD